MRVICILCDSLNRHFLPAYGGPDLAETPNIDWLAERSFVFENHFSGSLPTMPTRREVWTGFHEFLWRPWGALEPWDRDLPELLGKQDILTMLINDSYHLYERGSGNYHINFDGWEFIRGHEHDPWITRPTEMPDYKGNLSPRYVRNMTTMVHEEDYCAPKTFHAVENWLEANHTHEQFFLMVDEFSPHEPFHTPDYYLEKYDPDYDGPLLFWPSYGKDLFDERETRHLRARYAAAVTMVDRHLGRVFDKMTALDMWKDTALILMTDHGHYLGEHGFFGKPSCPQYDTLVHIPFLLHVPGLDGGGKRIQSVSANVDVFATVLDLFGIEPAPNVHSRSLLPVVRGEADQARAHALYGYFGKWTNITDGRMTYFRAPQQPDAGLNIYSLRWDFGLFKKDRAFLSDALEVGRFMPDVPMPVGRHPVDRPAFQNLEPQNFLFDLTADPGQETNLAGTETEAKYKDLLRQAMQDVHAPEEQFARMGL